MKYPVFNIKTKNHFSRYSVPQLMEFEKDPVISKQKCRTISILLTFFLLYDFITTLFMLTRPNKHSIITNIAVFILFLFLKHLIRKTGRHTTITIFGTFMLSFILFLNFVMEVDWTIGMDAFWLFILITPFITIYLAGAVYGSISATSGLILSLILFRTPLINYLQPYGQNMLDFYPIIYLVAMASAAVLGYELTAYQIEKKESDEQLTHYQSERENRLKQQLEIYENNEQTIRKYRHDIRHFNRVLAGFIHDGEYDKAESYLHEFDSMLEGVTAVSFCDNKIVNELLSIYSARCHKMGIKLRVKAVVPEHFAIESIDLTSLVANALENALESQEKLPEIDRYIKVDINFDGRKLKLITRNPCRVETEFDERGIPISTRTVKSGIGAQQIDSIARKYGGASSFTQEDGFFTVKAVLTCM